MLSLQAKRSLAIGLRKLMRCLTGTSFRGCLRRPSMCIGEAVPIALQADRTCVHVYACTTCALTQTKAQPTRPCLEIYQDPCARHAPANGSKVAPLRTLPACTAAKVEKYTF